MRGRDLQLRRSPDPAWPVLVDAAVVAAGAVVIGSGVRRSKLLVDGAALAELPTAAVVDLAQH